MLFNKNRNKMIDIRELQKRGVVRIPKRETKTTIPTTKEGFVEIGQTKKSTSVSNADFFGFIDNSTKSSTQNREISTEQDGYNKREVDSKITNLDNKIYKLEQRIELLERKLDISNSSGNTGVMGW